MTGIESRKRIAIVQSSYIPWKGYFDIIRAVDEFVFLDDVQFTRRDWRNRNRIKTPQGSIWLSIPVISRGRYRQTIDEVQVAEEWADRHWQTIARNYRRAAEFETFAGAVERLFQAVAVERSLSAINRRLIAGICGLLDIRTAMRRSHDYSAEGVKTDRLVSICRAAGATEYLSGPSAASYIEPDKFARNGIALSYVDYTGYPPYTQLYGEFEHGVSVLDLMFNTGHSTLDFMKHF